MHCPEEEFYKESLNNCILINGKYIIWACSPPHCLPSGIVCFCYRLFPLFPFCCYSSCCQLFFFPCFHVCKLIVMSSYVFLVHCYMYIMLWSFHVVCISFKSNCILFLVSSFRSIKIEWDPKLGKQHLIFSSLAMQLYELQDIPGIIWYSGVKSLVTHLHWLEMYSMTYIIWPIISHWPQILQQHCISKYSNLLF